MIESTISSIYKGLEDEILKQLLDLNESEETLDKLQENIDWDGSNCLDLPQHWLTVPDSVRLIANCYDRAFAVFSTKGSYTCFPARAPTADDLGNAISIVHNDRAFCTFGCYEQA
ncbi:hypothetical protein MUCCIDRAFT_80006 [Mucor lusitanicus CBS 277.49]|uniref:Uncharacterized protein n=1 Tax=Mucor lusitanicus CBS 277.49 TaxID=747725 RepID=A0A168MGW3_MUCCL|nr:hypothetical protein MUCCIDRAFT_80006 [Mucor lusitanicus CBS 277.49]